MRLSKENCLNKNISNRLSQPILKTRNSQIHQCYDIIPFDSKSK